MSKFKSPLDLYKLLKKSNCQECLLPSCMAFAVAVIQNTKKLSDCPYIDTETQNELSASIVKKKSRTDEQEEILVQLMEKIKQTDLAKAARRLDAPFREKMIFITCLGKDFKVDGTGNMISECHKNSWVQIPVLNYILHSKALEPKGEWVAFGGLKGAGDWSQFFSHRCELGTKKLAVAHTELFFEILHLFGAQELKGVTNADHSLLIYPLPKVPLLINYWEPEGPFEAKLNMLFDSTAADNIKIESLYLLCQGLVEMFRELLTKHSKDGKLF